ncbi:MAG: DUF4249 domain-containing protein [Bacteroidetes bacterium]|nr:DUF4249 domain-containing protein [Bacteroidota bacterium]MBI3482046.1 DUF4249 domain-containing protein [Bacteroidota bacterium]
MKYSRFIIFFLLLDSCVSPYDINSSQYHQSIVVEGMITDQPGPHVVKISKAVQIRDQVLKTEWVTGATVIIKDDIGNSETLVEKSSGNYYASTIQGMIGRSYSLVISTKSGESYESSRERLLPVGDFTDLRAEFQMNQETNYLDQVKSRNGFKIFLNSEVLPSQESRVWWRWTGTFEILTYPQFRTRPVPNRSGLTVLVPDPVPCSGFINRSGALVQASPCTCCICWVTQYNQIPEISDPRFINNGRIDNQYIGFIETNVRTFYDKYYLEVEQLSVSQAVYDFWKKVKIQKENSSNLFQTPPPKTSGNITALSADATPVIGYFSASSVVKHSIVLKREDVPYHLNPIDTLAISCTDAYKFSSTSKPTFW